MLIILGGLPGSGKTTIAQALAVRLGAVHVRVDTMEQAMRDGGAEVGPAGYLAAYGVAADNLSLGHVVIADSVNSIAITRNAWRDVAARSGNAAVEIELICSDKVEHRRRAETRMTDVAGLRKPSWQEILERPYEDWQSCHIVVDTALQNVDDIVEDLVSALKLPTHR